MSTQSLFRILNEICSYYNVGLVAALALSSHSLRSKGERKSLEQRGGLYSLYEIYSLFHKMKYR